MDEAMNAPGETKPQPAGAPTVEVRGESLLLLPERAVYWPSQSALLVADLHWGKDEAFRRQGSPLPQGVLKSDLSRLQRCIEQCGARRVVILGDLIHNRDGVSEGVVAEVAAWRKANPIAMTLIPGNHDRHLRQLPPGFDIEVAPAALALGRLVLTHDPTREDRAGGDYVVGGHIHPVFRVRSRNDQIRLPCFHIGMNHALLPAFSEFAGGFMVTAKKGDQIYVTDGRVVLPAPHR